MDFKTLWDEIGMFSFTPLFRVFVSAMQCRLLASCRPLYFFRAVLSLRLRPSAFGPPPPPMSSRTMQQSPSRFPCQSNQISSPFNSPGRHRLRLFARD